MPQLMLSSLLMIIIAVMPTFSRADETQNNLLLERDHVIGELHHSNQIEIEMGKLAKARGRSDAIKDFGALLVTEHTDADKKVMELAKSQNMNLDNSGMSMSEKENKVMSKLRSLYGSEFDCAFAEAMVTDHQQDIDKLQTAKISLAGTPTGDLVTVLLPVVQKHEDIAVDLVGKLKVNGNQRS